MNEMILLSTVITNNFSLHHPIFCLYLFLKNCQNSVIFFFPLEENGELSNHFKTYLQTIVRGISPVESFFARTHVISSGLPLFCLFVFSSPYREVTPVA